MQVGYKNNDVNFGALLRAQYSCKNNNTIDSVRVSIVQLERKDYRIADEFLANIQQYANGDKVKEEILKGTFLTLKELFASDCQFLDKLKVLVATHDKRPFGILIGNMPKKTLDGYVTYSSRHNSSIRETEVDWLATWSCQEQISGIGKALMCEFSTMLEKDKLKDVFVRSELPENSYAQSFYELFGFEQLQNKYMSLRTKTTNEPLVKDYGKSSDLIVSMLAKTKIFQERTAQIAEDMDRVEFCPKSKDAEKLINC